MTAQISITESNVMRALGDFLTLSIGIEVIQGLDNMVPEPLSVDFAAMTPIGQKRLSFNVTDYADCSFLGSIIDGVLTIEELNFGTVVVGSQLFGPTVAANTLITEELTSDTFSLSVDQTVTAESMATGNRQDLVPQIVTIQVDIHGPSSSEKSIIAEGLFRSGWGFDNIKASGYDISPLYCSEPRQIVFNNAEQQNEKRWSIDFSFQVNPIITIPQQFADSLEVEIVEVDTTYPV